MQLAPAASDAPQALVPVVIAKSSGLGPTMLGTMPVSELVPVFESVATSAVAVVFSTVLGKTRDGVSEAVGAPLPIEIELLVMAISPPAAADRV